MSFNINKVKSANTYDVIVVGSGASGSWAAKEFSEQGLRTLLLERGRDVEHIKDYPTTNMYPYEFEHRLEMPYEDKVTNPIVNRCYAYKEDSQHFFVKDQEHPYIQVKDFDWIRGYQVGGKSLLWARQVQRWSDFDFEGPARDGFAVDWPIRYTDIAPWYSYVERFIGVSGNQDNIPELPDGEFLPPFPLGRVEQHLKETVANHFPGRHVISARCAHLSKAQPIHFKQGRTDCVNRLLCQRGCPFGGYYSANAVTIPWAKKTGNLTLRTHAVVHSVLYEETTKKAVGVKVIDANSKEEIDYFARVIFLNASTLNTNLILLNSKSNRFPEGLGNDNQLLGKYVAFHNYTALVMAEYEGFQNYKTTGRNPAAGAYMPRFRNLHKQDTDFLRGWSAGISTQRKELIDPEAVGIDLKNSLLNPRLGPWSIFSYMMGETLPKESNLVTLDNLQTDSWGIPLLRIDVDYDDNDRKMRDDYFQEMGDMFDKAGFTNIKKVPDKRRPGNDIHEMGGARMGVDPRTSIVNKWNQIHSCKNVFVTDGACMTSTSTQNPTLTFMALTARAANYALGEMKKRNL
ncbi:GMC oxidoreductase [Sphingobacterium faecale]|uniref:GMC family oxidoreductase n=1 Tax=Sphingobacterium faecale TaxID=2803775 RepID=A0ABS1RA41_9SPHI|nr:GMC family oxidoreductase [Sphingobacterium faecale]MBL1411190.1 GMC family oxidoreductase [Sphingobacterium faecale]